MLTSKKLLTIKAFSHMVCEYGSIETFTNPLHRPLLSNKFFSFSLSAKREMFLWLLHCHHFLPFLYIYIYIFFLIVSGCLLYSFPCIFQVNCLLVVFVMSCCFYFFNCFWNVCFPWPILQISFLSGWIVEIDAFVN